jgi:hypothetical protein
MKHAVTAMRIISMDSASGRKVPPAVTFSLCDERALAEKADTGKVPGDLGKPPAREEG